MAWPDATLIEPPATEVAALAFTGAVQTFDVTPDMVPGALTLWLRGGRGEGRSEHRFNLRNTILIPLTDGDVGTWTVAVGGDAAGSNGGWGGGGDGGQATAGPFTDGGGGGGGTFVWDPTGEMRAWVGGTGGAAGGVTDGFVPAHEYTPPPAIEGFGPDPIDAATFRQGAITGVFAIGADGTFQGQGGNMNPDRTLSSFDDGTGYADSYLGWILVETPAGQHATFGTSSTSTAIDGRTVGLGGTGGTLAGTDLIGPGGGGGGGGRVAGGGGGAADFADLPYYGGGPTVQHWGLGPGGHGDTHQDLRFDWPADGPGDGWGRGGASVAAGWPWFAQITDLGAPISEPDGAALIAWRSDIVAAHWTVGAVAIGTGQGVTA